MALSGHWLSGEGRPLFGSMRTFRAAIERLLREGALGQQSSKGEAANQGGCGPGIWTYAQPEASGQERPCRRVPPAKGVEPAAPTPRPVLSENHIRTYWWCSRLLPARCSSPTLSTASVRLGRIGHVRSTAALSPRAEVTQSPRHVGHVP